MTDKPKIFSGEKSKRFWAAVWGYWDMLKGKDPMDEDTRFNILYKYGCKAQDLEKELTKLKSSIDEEKRHSDGNRRTNQGD